MENATNASPPHTSVEILGGYDARNGYVITVADRGIGMSDAQLADANHHLAHPPMVGLVISRSLGLTVVGRLAARYGLAVRLEPREDGGVVATVELPYGLVEYPGEDAAPAPSALEVMASVGGRPTRPRRTARPAPTAAAASPAPPVEAAAPAAPMVATPAGLPRRGGVEITPTATPAPAPAPSPASAPIGRVTSPAIGDAPVAPPAPPAAAPTAIPAPAPVADPPAVTAAGLVKRTPTARTSDQSADSGNQRAVTRTTRSPEEVRRMLSRYRSGLDRGRTGPSDGGPESFPTHDTPNHDTPNQGAEE
jgi:hypothetical protein